MRTPAVTLWPRHHGSSRIIPDLCAPADRTQPFRLCGTDVGTSQLSLRAGPLRLNHQRYIVSRQQIPLSNVRATLGQLRFLLDVPPGAYRCQDAHPPLNHVVACQARSISRQRHLDRSGRGGRAMIEVGARHAAGRLALPEGGWPIQSRSLQVSLACHGGLCASGNAVSLERCSRPMAQGRMPSFVMHGKGLVDTCQGGWRNRTCYSSCHLVSSLAGAVWRTMP